MAEKLLKETKDAQVKKKRTKKAADEENIEIKDVYKIDFGQEEIDRKKPTKTATTKATRTRSKKNVIKVVEDKEDDDPDVRPSRQRRTPLRECRCALDYRLPDSRSATAAAVPIQGIQGDGYPILRHPHRA